MNYPSLLDGSLLLRPECSPHGGEMDKPVAKFRDYTIDPSDPLKERVRRTYHEMHKNQTVAFVKSKVGSTIPLPGLKSVTFVITSN